MQQRCVYFPRPLLMGQSQVQEANGQQGTLPGVRAV